MSLYAGAGFCSGTSLVASAEAAARLARRAVTIVAQILIIGTFAESLAQESSSLLTGYPNPSARRCWSAPFFIHHNPGRSEFARSMRVSQKDVSIMTSESSRFPDFSGCSQIPFALLQVTSCFSTGYPFAPQIRPETRGAISPSSIRLTRFGRGFAVRRRIDAFRGRGRRLGQTKFQPFG